MSSGYSWLAARGLTDYFVEHTFGTNDAVSTAYELIANDGIYRTPKYDSPVQLRVKAGNVNDTAAGSGAQKILLIGMDSDGVTIVEQLATAGASASALTTKSFVRLFRIEVSESGTYAEVGAYSHAAAIVIETSGGVQWGKIAFHDDIPHGISQIGAFTVPASLTRASIEIEEAYVLSYTFTVDSGKSCDFLMMHRDNADCLTAPYSSNKVIREHLQIGTPITVELSVPLGPFKPHTDISVFAKAVTSASVSIDLELALVKK